MKLGEEFGANDYQRLADQHSVLHSIYEKIRRCHTGRGERVISSQCLYPSQLDSSIVRSNQGTRGVR